MTPADVTRWVCNEGVTSTFRSASPLSHITFCAGMHANLAAVLLNHRYIINRDNANFEAKHLRPAELLKQLYEHNIVL